MTTKPTFLESDIWANAQVEGVNIVNPDNTYKSIGWIYGQKPPYTVTNWIQNTNDSLLVHLNQNGIMTWDINTEYALGAQTKYNDIVYISRIAANTGNAPVDDPYAGTPVNDTNWAQDIANIDDNITIVSAGAPDGNKIVMTNSDGLLDVSLTALGGMVYNGDIDITIPHPDIGSVDSGDYYTVQAAGTFEASWTGLAGTDAEQSETFIYDGTQWNMLGNGVNDNYLLRNGSKPMFNPLTSTVVTGTAPFVVASTTLVTNLNADLLDGETGADFHAWGNITSVPSPTYAITGDANASLGATLLGSNISLAIEVTNATNSFTVGADDVTNNITTLYGDTFIGSVSNPSNLNINGTTETNGLTINGTDIVEIIEDTLGGKILGGTKITSTYNDTTGETTIDHTVVGSQASVNNSGAFAIQDVTLDQGHVTGLVSVEITSTITPYDNTTSGLTATFVKTAIDELDTNTDNVISGVTNITYDTGISGLTATTVKTAIDEVAQIGANNAWPVEHDFIANGSQDTFSPGGGYIVGKIFVYSSGIKLRSTEFTASNGIDVILDQVPDVDTWIQVVTAQG